MKLILNELLYLYTLEIVFLIKVKSIKEVFKIIFICTVLNIIIIITKIKNNSIIGLTIDRNKSDKEKIDSIKSIICQEKEYENNER